VLGQTVFCRRRDVCGIHSGCSVGAGTVVTDVDYCYDWADRLTSTNATTTGGNPVLNTDLSTVGAPATLAYDTHGNTTKLADQTLTYDVADRHMSTVLADGTTITYVRDATGRVVSRITDAPGTANDSTIRYSFAGGTLFAMLDGSNQVLQRELSLPGGVSLSIPATGGQVWAYPNLHGDVILTTDATGIRQGARTSYGARSRDERCGRSTRSAAPAARG